jgi:hypothetical protein|tara:strand:+ start:272 stop:1177 length:906 start_codon:yes stop_codon:yes gene_type:complete
MLISSSIDNELLKFIDSKKIGSSEVTAKEIYQLYTKMILDILYNVHITFLNTQYSITCCELAHSIFLIILHYTNNSKLAMFLCDRAKILFIEYINISNEMDSHKTVNMLDVKLYIYSKTIGPLSLTNNKNIKIAKLKNLFILYKKIMYKVYTYIHNNIKFIDNEDIETCDNNTNISIVKDKDKDNLFSIYKNHLFYTIDTIKEKIYMKIYKCYFFINNVYLENILYIESIENIFITINKVNVKLQCIIDYKNKYKKGKRLQVINKINKLVNEYNMCEYIDSYIINQNIKKTDIYKNLIQSL